MSYNMVEKQVLEVGCEALSCLLLLPVHQIWLLPNILLCLTIVKNLWNICNMKGQVE